MEVKALNGVFRLQIGKKCTNDIYSMGIGMLARARKDIFKGTNGRQKTYEIFHVYCIFYSGFMCQTTVIFGITKDGSLVLNTLAS